MRKCRKMISVIMLMVMLVSLLPTGAMAAEAPTGATNEVASVEEPQGNTDEAKNEDITNGETDKTEDSSTDTSDSGAKENDGTNEVVPTDGTTVETTDGDPAEGTNTEDAGLGNTSTEDAGLGITSTEIAAEVEPTDKTVKKDEKAAGGANLWDYFAEHPEMGSLEVFVDGKKVDENSEPIKIEWEKEYKIEVFLTAKGLAPNSYTIDLPSVFTYKLKDKDGNILTQVPLVREDESPVGYYEVGDHGPVTLVLDKEMNTQQDLGYTLTFYCTVEEQLKIDIDYHGIPFTIDRPEGVITIKKWNYYDLKLTYLKDVKGEDGNTVRHFHWRTEVQHDKWTTPENCTFTDTLTNTNHKFTDWDKASGQGIVITATKEGHDTVTWTLTKDNIAAGVFEWGDSTWTYVMPASMNGTTFDEGWKFQFDYWTTQVVKPTLSDKYYTNSSEYKKENWAGSVIESHATLHQGAEGVSNFNKAGFPDYDKDTLRLKGMKYEISSDVSVDPEVQYGYIDEIHYYGYPNTDKDRKISDANNPGWTDIKVSFTLLEKNGNAYNEIKTYENIPVVNEGDPAPAAADENDGYYAVYFDIHGDKNNAPIGTYSGHKYRAILIVNKNYEGEPESWTGLGKSMLYGDRARITLSYYQKHTPEFKEELTNNNVYYLINTAHLWRNHQVSSGDTDVVSYMGRSKTLLDPPTADNGNIAEFKVGFPISEDVDEDDKIYFVDEMLVSNNFKLESITLQKFEFGNGDKFSGGKAIGEPYAPDPKNVKTLIVEHDGKKYRQLWIELDHEQVYYELIYKVRASTNESEKTNKGIPFNNTFWIVYGDKTVTPIPVPNTRTSYSIFSQSYEVTIHKTDEAGSPLKGAEFNLYDEEGYAPIPENVTYSTDENGDVKFGTNIEDNIIYNQNHPYYIMETKAPEGYEQDNTKHWFVIVDDSYEAFDYEDFFEKNGITDYKVIDGKTENSVTINVVNKQSNIEIPVEKTWNDNKNKHDNVTVKLFAGDKDTGKTLVLNEENSFKGKFTDIPKTDESGKTIVYTVKEVTVAGYKSVVTGSAAEGFKITNTPMANIAVEKIWNDVNDVEGKRPTSLIVYLTKDGSRMTGKDYSVTLDKSNEWKHTWPNLPLTDENGKEITYSVEEDEVKGYTAGQPVKKSETTDEQTGETTVTYTITNTYVPKTEVSVKKVWNDANNQDGVRPTSITVFLTKDGKKVDGTNIILDGTVDTLPDGSPNPELESVKWGHTWSDLDKYDSDGNLIAYGVDEDKDSMPKDYSKNVTPNGTEFTITNTYEPGKVKAQVTKSWDDADNQDGLRTSVDVQLMKNGQSMGNAYKATLTKENNWYKEWTGLDEKDGGVAIQYTVAEISKINGYSTIGPNAEYDAATKTWKISITNEHTPKTIKINVAKVWDDNNDQDGKRPASINVYLTKDGTKDESTKQTLSEANGWTYTWDNLPLNKKEGQEITYSVTEDVIADYNIDDKTGESKAAEAVKVKEETDPKTGIKTVFYSLTNTHGPEKTNVYVEKEWDDKNDQDGVRPAKIIVKLIDRDDPEEKAIQSTELSEAKGWSYTFTNLPKYKKTAAGSVEITYDVTETVEGTDSLNGYNLTKTTIAEDALPEGVEGVGFAYHLKNTYEPAKTTAHVKKVWNDAGNMDKRRPAEITVKLVKDGTPVTGSEVTLDGKVDENETVAWEYTWTGLQKLRDGGEEILYTVEETSISDQYAESGYSKNVEVDRDHTNGFKITVTNTHNERPVSISKVDITNSEEVEGATLQILLNDKVVMAKDEKGKDVEAEWKSGTEPHTVYGLTPGVEYTLRETIQPDGYTIAADTTFTIAADGKVTSSGTVTENNVVLVEDAPTKVNVRKVDAANDKELPGATLQIIDPEGKVFAQWTSTEEDHKVTGLTAGVEYTLRETVAPLGFTVTSDTKFTVDNNNKVTSTGTVSTNKDGEPVLVVEDTMTIVKISKTDITGDEELKGATLQILDESGNVVTVKDHDGKDVKCEWVSTDKPHVVEGLEIDKTYTLRETTAPDGFIITADATFRIDKDNRITTEIPRNSAGVLLVKDKPTKVKVSKVDITGEKELQGATLQILDSEGKVVEIKDNDGKVVETCEWVSTKEPKDIIGLKTGVVYTLRETIAPDGYTIATEFQFTIATDGKVTCTGKTTTAEDGTTVLLVEDEPTKVYISKVDITNEEELPGATLQILDEEENVVVIKDNDGNPVETLEWVSGEEPKYIEGLPTGVNYILRETISPDGYTIASDTKFTIDEKGEVTSDGTTSKTEDGTDVTILVVKDDLTTVQISKVDTESGAELEGAKIQIIDEEGKVVEEWTSTKEVHVVRGLVANKKYILREQVAPLGYTLTSDTTFSIDMNNVVTSTGPVNKDGVILINDTMTEVEILKVDSKTGKGLAGAKLQVLDDNGKVCDEWKSTKDAHKIRGLYTGVKYTLHEVEAPKGYDKAKDITFTIDTAGKVSSDALDNGKIVMKDTPTPKKNKTGDEANGSLWALLLMMASGALGGTVWFKRKRRV